MSIAEPPLEIIDVGPFSGAFLNTWDAICLRGIRVFSYPLDSFLSCFVRTTRDLKNPLQRHLYVVMALPFWALCTFLTSPVGVLFVLLWLPISGFRKPYRFSYVKNAPQLDRNAKNSYTCVTSNVCLMHEVLTRFNNQQNTQQKAREIGRRIATQQLGLEEEYASLTQKNLTDSEVQKLRDEKLMSMGVELSDDVSTNGKKKGQTNSKINDHTQNRSNVGKRLTRSSVWNDTATEERTWKYSEKQFDHSVLAEFPDVDFLCFQETWDIWHCRELIKELHQVFPYVIYDARVDSPSSNMFMLNSGTMIASRYPIVDIDFKYYRCSYMQCRLASKGLLQAKVSLGVTPGGRPATGYLSNTHLQAYQGTYPVHARQMDDIVQWTDDFRSRKHVQNEVVAFDVIGGDFNVDNMSPVDRAVRYHELFNIYEDACRMRPGLDHEWTLGTEMRHTPLDDPLIQTPLGLQLTLQHPYLLQQYVISADIEEAILEMAYTMPARDKQGNIILSPVGGKRRIDYVLYRKGDGVKVTSCNAVTQLAGLTDHIPFSLTFDVSL